MDDYQLCTRCVMDTTDSRISFDENGVCNHCKSYDDLVCTKWNINQYISNNSLYQLFDKIKKSQKNKKYDCLIGLSGGVDSSYIALLAKRHNLRPLCIHLDNGWNSELATYNIHGIVEKCGFDLYTHVIDWVEFRELQKAFFKADVIDLEILTDHAIFGVIIQEAKRHGIKYILSGANYSSEFVMPKTWVHRKQDLDNIKAINEKFGTKKIKTFPQVSTLKHIFIMYGLGFKVQKPLNYIEFNKEKAKIELREEFGWRDYGGKHYESIFTRLYQAHILPKKFGVDKRRPHLSSLILSKQISRDAAIEELEKPLYDEKELEEDVEYLLKKLEFSRDWFHEYLKRPGRSHYDFKTDQKLYDFLLWVKNKISKN